MNGFVCTTGTASQQCSNTGHQFIGIERLGQVIIGSQIQAAHPVRDAVPGGQDNNRSSGAHPAHGTQDLGAVHVGQSQVQHHNIVLLFFQALESALTGRHPVN